MPWKKGESGNPGGLNVRQQRVRNMIEGLSIAAVLRLEKLLASDNEPVALAAAKEVLGRVVPLPPRTATLQVEHSASPHLAALVTLAASTAARVQTVPGNHPQLVDIAGPLTIDNQLTDVDVDAEEAVSVDVDRST